jgi:hypothetical protein
MLLQGMTPVSFFCWQNHHVTSKTPHKEHPQVATSGNALPCLQHWDWQYARTPALELWAHPTQTQQPHT